MKKALIGLCILIAAAAASAGGAIIWADKNFSAPGPLKKNKIVMIERGQGVRQIAATLMQEGVIQYDWLFAGKVRWLNLHTQLRAGEYEFKPKVSPKQVLDKILNNQTVIHSITIPEGLTSSEIAAILNDEQRLTGDYLTFEKQGILLPETYHFSRNDERSLILNRMKVSMEGLKNELWSKRQKGLPLKTWEEAVTLASIVEKETGQAEERPHIASVFINRLNLGMRLQSDPTVVFALTEGTEDLDRSLTRKDWKLQHPYNTYVINGLPPGPIANPGRAAIEAVLNPIDSKDLYFVADGTGGHAFARTLKQHNRNVAKWRRIKKKKQSGN